MRCKIKQVYLEKQKVKIVVFHFWVVNAISWLGTFSLTVSVLYSESPYFTARQLSLALLPTFI